MLPKNALLVSYCTTLCWIYRYLLLFFQINLPYDVPASKYNDSFAFCTFKSYKAEQLCAQTPLSAARGTVASVPLDADTVAWRQAKQKKRYCPLDRSFGGVGQKLNWKRGFKDGNRCESPRGLDEAQTPRPNRHSQTFSRFLVIRPRLQ